MMMVLCFLMSIPLKMMAFAEVKVVSHYLQPDNWSENSNFKFNTTDGKIYTCKLDNVPSGTQAIWFRIVKEGKEYGPGNGSSSDLVLTGTYQQIFEGTSNALKIVPTSGKTSYTITYNYETNQIKYDAPESGGGSTTVNWDTVTKNRLTGKKYTQGFYLAGNFFSFQPKEGANQITYDDAVFKFQQQKNDSTIESGKDYVVYKVEIPASLTAHAQVMYVDEFGKTKNIFGPGSAYGISRTCPETDGSKGWLNTTANVCDPITQENTNYWNFKSRNETENEYSDGMYNLYIAVDATTHTVAKWKIVHDSDRRVAYFISDATDATAMPIYDAYDANGVKYFSNRFYGSVNFAENHSYYVISNIVRGRESDIVDRTKDTYGTVVPTSVEPNSKSNYNPTTNKLFLMGNGGLDFANSDPENSVCPNEKPIKFGADWSGNQIVEYNPNKSNRDRANKDEHLGFVGEVQFQGGKRVKITSVSMVGDAIPGTFKVDETTGKEVWDYTSNAADMKYDDVEQCYKTTVITRVGEGKKHFRFVGNHNKDINWYEDTDGTEPDKMAKTPLTDSKAKGHTADANDPNKVNYTQSNENPEEKWNIIWNRPAGRWTVRLYFYTYNVAGEPVTDYYYTISANRELELRDFEDVVYKSLDNKRNIHLRGGYRYFRTWSAVKAWKISKDVDIFVVDDVSKDGDCVKVSLKQISADETDNVIPSNTGVILATKKNADEIDGGAEFFERASLTTYNTLVIPIEEYGSTTATTGYHGTNWLKPLTEAQVVPTYNKVTDEYNYLFGFYRANKVSDKPYKDNDFLLGFWLSNGKGAFYNNSAYLPIPKATAEKMNLGVSYEFLESGGSAKKVPGVIFDFDNVGGTTGINEVVNQSAKLNDGKYYTLSGQQVEKPTAGGIYIHNGRKFVVK